MYLTVSSPNSYTQRPLKDPKVLFKLLLLLSLFCSDTSLIIHCSLEMAGTFNFLPCNTFLCPSFPQTMSNLPHHTTLSSNVPSAISMCILRFLDSCFFPKVTLSESFAYNLLQPHHLHARICVSLAGHSLKSGTSTWSFFFVFKSTVSHNIQHMEQTSIYSHC